MNRIKPFLFAAQPSGNCRMNSASRLKVFHANSLLLAICALALTLQSSVAAEPAVPAAKSLRALLVLGGCCHDYAAQKEILARGIAERARVEVVIAYDDDTTTKHLNPVYEKPNWAAGYDVIIHDECSADVKDLAVIDRILAPHRQGLPAVILHCGMHSYRSEGFPQAVTPWFEFSGLQTTAHGPQAPIDVSFLPSNSPITKGLADWRTINEELYNNFTGKLLDTATPLARGRQTVQQTRAREHLGLRRRVDKQVSRPRESVRHHPGAQQPDSCGPALPRPDHSRLTLVVRETG